MLGALASLTVTMAALALLLAPWWWPHVVRWRQNRAKLRAFRGYTLTVVATGRVQVHRIPDGVHTPARDCRCKPVAYTVTTPVSGDVWLVDHRGGD